MSPAPAFSWRRFLVIWAIFAALYLAVAAAGVFGPRGGQWPLLNQHLLQVLAWLGEGREHGALDVTELMIYRGVPPERDPMMLDLAAVPVTETDAAADDRPAVLLVANGVAHRLHVGFPLGPSLLLFPLRLLLGGWLAVQWVAAVLGGLAVAALDAVLRQWLARFPLARPPARPRGLGDNGLVVLAGLGTLWPWIVQQSTVWCFAQAVATTGLTLAILLAWRRQWTWAGLAYAFALTSRPTMVLALPLLIGLAWRSDRDDATPPRLTGWPALARAAVFPLVLGSVVLGLNAARFGDPLEFGYRYMNLAPGPAQRFAEHGQFSPAYLSRNAWWLLAAPPVSVHHADGRLAWPGVVSHPQGMGVLFVTPAFAAVLWTLRRATRGDALVRLAWLSLVAMTGVVLLYFNTGWVQWGGRFLVDAWPLWLMLAALGLRAWPRWVAYLAVGVGVLSNAWATTLSASGAWPIRALVGNG